MRWSTGTLGADLARRVLARFVERYGQVYGEGALLPGGGNEVELHRVVGTTPIEPAAVPEHTADGATPRRRRRASAACTSSGPGSWRPRSTTAAALQSGNVIDGPAIIERMGDSVVVPPGFQAAVDPYLSLRLTKAEQAQDGTGADTAAATAPTELGR